MSYMSSRILLNVKTAVKYGNYKSTFPSKGRRIFPVSSFAKSFGTTYTIDTPSLERHTPNKRE